MGGGSDEVQEALTDQDDDKQDAEEVTRIQIIRDIVTEENFRAVAAKITRHSQDLDDLLQDLAEQILAMPEERFEKIRTPRAYCIGYLWKQYNSSTSPYFKKYKQKGIMVEMAEFRTDIIEEVYDSTEDEQIQMITQILKEMEEVYGSSDWYDATLFQRWLAEGSYKRLSDKTGIHYRSVRNTVKEVKERILERVTNKPI